MKKLYQFLGSIRFALILIITTTLFVIVGTILESINDSHLYASQLTYQSPLFTLLLIGFFLNILISALRRWPFKLKHIPFLTTHLGLLMLLTGTFIKNQWGTQGSMAIIEGSIGQQIFLANSQALRLENRQHQALMIPLQDQFTIGSLSLNRIAQQDHSKVQLRLWMSEDAAHIEGLPPLPLADIDQPLIEPSAYLEGRAIYTLQASDVSAAIDKIYRQTTTVRISDSSTGRLIQERPLAEEELKLNFSTVRGFDEPTVTIEGIKISLSGADALLNKSSTPYLGATSSTIDLATAPALLLIQDKDGDEYHFIFDAFGRVFSEAFRADKLNSLFILNEGFGGYAARSTLDLASQMLSRVEIEQQQLDLFSESFRQAMADSPTLPPPLQLLSKAAEKSQQDFVDTTVDFLQEWHQSQQWLYPKERPLPNHLKVAINALDWTSLPASTQRACALSSLLLEGIEEQLIAGQSVKQIMTDKRWPLAHLIQDHETEGALTAIHQQLEEIGDQLPFVPLKAPKTAEEKAHLLTAYLRSNHIHLSHLLFPIEISSTTSSPWFLETPVKLVVKPAAAGMKIEENTPSITLLVNNHEQITLPYDRHGTGLHWPILNGEYLIRFQPHFIGIPYSIRLRDARQINYPNSSQPYSYEADILITDLRNKTSTAATLSMNKVYETWDGYRFYLANISPGQEISAQRAQIIVNHDPVKYYVTYPGACVVSAGIILLFGRLWRKRYEH